MRARRLCRDQPFGTSRIVRRQILDAVTLTVALGAADRESGAAKRCDTATGSEAQGQSQRPASDVRAGRAVLANQPAGTDAPTHDASLANGRQDRAGLLLRRLCSRTRRRFPRRHLRSRTSFEPRPNQHGRARAALRDLSENQSRRRRRTRRQACGDVQQDRTRRAGNARQHLCVRAKVRRCARAVRVGLQSQSQRYGADLPDRDDVRAAKQHSDGACRRSTAR